MNLTFDCDSSCRHLQRFWGASGDFWQDLWTKLYVKFEGHDAALFYFGKETTAGSKCSVEEQFANGRLSFTVNNRAVFCRDKSRTTICFLNDSILKDLFCIDTNSVLVSNIGRLGLVHPYRSLTVPFRGTFHSSAMKCF